MPRTPSSTRRKTAAGIKSPVDDQGVLKLLPAHLLRCGPPGVLTYCLVTASYAPRARPHRASHLGLLATFLNTLPVRALVGRADHHGPPAGHRVAKETRQLPAEPVCRILAWIEQRILP